MLVGLAAAAAAAAASFACIVAPAAMIDNDVRESFKTSRCQSQSFDIACISNILCFPEWVKVKGTIYRNSPMFGWLDIDIQVFLVECSFNQQIIKQDDQLEKNQSWLITIYL